MTKVWMQRHVIEWRIAPETPDGWPVVELDETGHMEWVKVIHVIGRHTEASLSVSWRINDEHGHESPRFWPSCFGELDDDALEDEWIRMRNVGPICWLIAQLTEDDYESRALRDLLVAHLAALS